MSTEDNNQGMSRRRFLWGAGAAAVGGGLLAACGDDDESSDDAADGGDAGADDTSPSDEASNGGGASGGTIKIGYVTPQTGPLAPFGEADAFVLGALREFLSDGVTIQGTTYGIEIIDKDSESNSNTAATVAQELIVQDGVQLMCVAQTPDTTVPVVNTCTNNEVPVLSNNAPWQLELLFRPCRIGGRFTRVGLPFVGLHIIRRFVLRRLGLLTPAKFLEALGLLLLGLSLLSLSFQYAWAVLLGQSSSRSIETTNNALAPKIADPKESSDEPAITFQVQRKGRRSAKEEGEREEKARLGATRSQLGRQTNLR